MHAALSVALQGQRIATPGARTPAPQTAQPTPGAPHPIGPSSSPLRPSGLVVGLRARLRTHFLAVTGTASPNWNLAEAGVSASIPEDAGPRLQNESLASD